MELGRNNIVSREMIKPSSKTIHHLKPHKLCFQDQMIPSTYSPFVYFFPNKGAHFSLPHLKTSLSHTLTDFYPLSGRVRDNLFIDCYDEGVPFVENRVESSMIDFLHDPQLHLLNQFLPLRPWHAEEDQSPLVAVQANIFDCGGIGLGVCLSHKMCDAVSANNFLRGWASNARDPCMPMSVKPKFSDASLTFPPLELDSLAQNSLLAARQSVLDQGLDKQVAKRYVFDANAVVTITEKAKGGTIENPTLNETISSFIWKSLIEATASTSGLCNTSFVVTHAMDIRMKMKPRLRKQCMGNIGWWAMATTDGFNDQGTNVRQHDLVSLTREAFANVTSDSLRAIQGEHRLEIVQKTASAQSNQETTKNVTKLGFSNCIRIGFNEVDFGFGKPVWIGLTGEPGPMVSNDVIIHQVGHQRDKIEAWFFIHEKLMAAIEQNTEFLTFANPNPSII